MGLIANNPNAPREAVSREYGIEKRAESGGDAPEKRVGRGRRIELIDFCHAFSLLGAVLILATMAMPSDMEGPYLALMLGGGGLFAVGIALGFVAYFVQLDATSDEVGAKPEAADSSFPPRSS